MKKIWLIILILSALAIKINCGGGSSSNPSGTTNVTLNLGQTRTASLEKEGLLGETAPFPSDVTSVRFTISGPDMVTIQRVVSTAGKTMVSETFEVTNGPDRYILVEALDASGSVLYRGETYVNMNGVPLTITIVLVSTQFVDLSISNVVNDYIDISFQINNSGNIAANDVLVYFLYSVEGQINCETHTVSVPAGNYVTRTVYSVYTSFYKIIVDPANAIPETDESNNVACDWSPEQCDAPPPTSCP